MINVFVIVAIILTCSSSYAGTGYTWEKTPNSSKEIMISGYINGFMAGYAFGINEGITSTMEDIKTTGNKVNDVNTGKSYDACSNYINSNFDKIYDSTLARNGIPSKSTKYYINEIETFLKTYPLCKKMDASELIEILVPVWFNLGAKKITYKDVGEGCATIK